MPLSPYASGSHQAQTPRMGKPSGAQDLVEALEEERQLFRARLPQQVTDPLDGEGADLADLDPGSLRQRLARKLQSKREPGSLRLAGQGESDHRSGTLVEYVLAEDKDWTMTGLFASSYRVEIGPADLSTSNSQVSVLWPGSEVAAQTFLCQSALFGRIKLTAGFRETSPLQAGQLFSDGGFNGLAAVCEPVLMHHGIDLVEQACFQGDCDFQLRHCFSSEPEEPSMIIRHTRGACQAEGLSTGVGARRMAG